MKTQHIFRFFFLIVFITQLSCVKKINPPVIHDQSFSIEEISPAGTLAGQVIAVDEDNEQILTYSILNGNTNDAFEISDTSGKLTVLNENAIDFETTPSFALSIEVKNSKGKSAVGKITVNLINVDPPAEGLLLYLPFDGNVNDLSSFNNNIIDSTSNNYVSGKWSQAFDFNGTSDYLKLSNTINSSNGLSFSFWINTRGPNGTENNGAVVAKYNMTTQLRCFMIYSFGSGTSRNDNRLAAAFYRYGYSSAYHDMTKSYLEPAELTVFPDPSLWTISNPLRLSKGVWTHCVINMTSDSIETWINGVLCTKKLREYTTYFDSPAEPVYIGNNFAGGDGTNNHFNGALDELRIYSRGLTPNEIKTLFKER
jgi:hypothetical protein